ncbi:hypothetical protein ACFLYL_02785 [Chloroflexota bacterium]
MKQGKPDWALTNVGWEVRKAVWLLWAMGETLPQTAIFLDLHADKFSDRQYHIDTLRRVRKELDTVPVELLDKLVDEVPGVKSFIEKNRSDYVSKRQDKATVRIGQIEEGACANIIKRIKEFYKDRAPPSGLKVVMDDVESED